MLGDMEESSQEVQSGNIHLKWLDSIYEKLKNIENMEVLSREGCESLMEFMQIPMQMQPIILNEVGYKNMRFLVTELKILVDSLQPVLKEKTTEYLKPLNDIEKVIFKKQLFLKEVWQNNQLVALEQTDIYYSTLKVLTQLKSNIIAEIAPLLYLPEEKKGKPWE